MLHELCKEFKKPVHQTQGLAIYQDMILVVLVEVVGKIEPEIYSKEVWVLFNDATCTAGTEKLSKRAHEKSKSISIGCVSDKDNLFVPRKALWVCTKEERSSAITIDSQEGIIKVWCNILLEVLAHERVTDPEKSRELVLVNSIHSSVPSKYTSEIKRDCDHAYDIGTMLKNIAKKLTIRKVCILLIQYNKEDR